MIVCENLWNLFIGMRKTKPHDKRWQDWTGFWMSLPNPRPLPPCSSRPGIPLMKEDPWCDFNYSLAVLLSIWLHLTSPAVLETPLGGQIGNSHLGQNCRWPRESLDSLQELGVVARLQPAKNKCSQSSSCKEGTSVHVFLVGPPGDDDPAALADSDGSPWNPNTRIN